MNNINLFLGFRSAKVEYKNSAFKKSSFSIGPFAGLGVVELNANNSDLQSDTEKTALGINYGIAIVGSVERVNFGLALGLESIKKDELENWIYNSKLYFGFICGYSLNNLD